VVLFLYLAVAGPSGLIRRHKMVADLDRVQRKLESVDEENARLVREINQLKDDDPTIRRAIAEQLLLVPAGSTVYRFTD
jgi:cell division protein FtsB